MSFIRPHAGPLELGTAAYPVLAPVAGPDGSLRYSDLVYSCEPGYRPLFLDLRLPTANPGGACPLIVWIHGGGYVHGSRKRQAPNIDAHAVIGRLTSAGYAVAVVDYRLAREAAFPAPVLDVRAAVRWLRAHADQLGLDPGRFVLWGESAGAHLALMAGWCDVEIPGTAGEFHEESEVVQAVVEWYGPADLADLKAPRAAGDQRDSSGETTSDDMDDLFDAMFGGTDWAAAEASPMTHVRADVPPTFIAHGSDDQLVPVEQGRLLHKALVEAGAQVEYLEVPGGHVFVGSDSIDHVVERGIAYLNAVLSAPPL